MMDQSFGIVEKILFNKYVLFLITIIIFQKLFIYMYMY